MIVNGTTYDDRTPQAVVNVLEASRSSRVRIRLWLGDTETGVAWLEDWQVIGRVGRSTGTSKIPILIHYARSLGGGAILDHCIVKIADVQSRRVLYQHPLFHLPELSGGPVQTKGYKAAVYSNDDLQAQFKSTREAENYIAFMRGERMTL